MRRLALILPAIIILSVALFRLMPRSEGSTAQTTARDIWNNPMSHEVKAALVDAFGPDALRIVVGVDQNVAVLSGTVGERSTRQFAEQVASSVDGVIVVHDFLSLAGEASPKRGPLTAEDEALRRRLSEELAKAVSVEACDGVVLLGGPVPDSNRRDTIMQIAENLSGVRRVVDLMQVAWLTSAPAASLVLGEDLMTPVGLEK